MTFNTPSSRTFDWSTAVVANVGTITVTVTGTLSDFRTASSTFNVVITNVCATATISAPSADGLNYALTGPASTKGIGTFILSVPACPVTYALIWTSNSTVVTNSFFSLSSGVLTIGPSSDITLSASSPYSLKVKAQIIGGNIAY